MKSKFSRVRDFKQSGTTKILPALTLNRDGNSSKNLIPRGIKEWQFNIPRGSRKIKSIPQGPLGPVGILGIEISKIMQHFLCWMLKPGQNKKGQKFSSWKFFRPLLFCDGFS